LASRKAAKNSRKQAKEEYRRIRKKRNEKLESLGDVVADPAYYTPRGELSVLARKRICQKEVLFHPLLWREREEPI